MTVNPRPHFLDIGYPIIPPAFKDEKGRPRDVSAATEIKVLAKRLGSGVETTFIGTLYDGPNGLIQRVTQLEDLDETGPWEIMGFVKFASGDEFHTDSDTITVSPNLDGGSGVSPGGISTHGTRHHHNGEDPLLVESLGALDSYVEATLFVTGPGTGIPEGQLAGLPFSTVAGALGPHLQETLKPVRLAALSYSSNASLVAADHWRHRLMTGSGNPTLTIPDSLTAGHMTFVSVTGTGTALFAASGSMVIVAGSDVVLAAGDSALIILDSATACRVLRLGKPRLEAATITGSETFAAAHHQTQRRYAISSAATVTFDSSRRGDEAVYDHMGATAGTLTFAAGTATITLPAGKSAAISANGTVKARYVATSTVYLSGDLDSL
jgi:hypothetical protein